MTRGELGEPFILYAEDDKDDQEALQEIVSDVAPHVKVIICNQGLELMQYLEQIQPGHPLPCCIILDMNMPLWDGLRTLEELKKHKAFRHVPVVMFTTSTSSRDAVRAMEKGAESFITKPVRVDEMKKVAEQFAIFCDYPVTTR